MSTGSKTRPAGLPDGFECGGQSGRLAGGVCGPIVPRQPDTSKDVLARIAEMMREAEALLDALAGGGP